MKITIFHSECRRFHLTCRFRTIECCKILILSDREREKERKKNLKGVAEGVKTTCIEQIV